MLGNVNDTTRFSPIIMQGELIRIDMCYITIDSLIMLGYELVKIDLPQRIWFKKNSVFFDNECAQAFGKLINKSLTNVENFILNGYEVTYNCGYAFFKKKCG